MGLARARPSSTSARLAVGWKLLAAGFFAAVGVSVLLLLVPGVYTPTTTAYIRNDTTESVTLDDCADSAVTVTPGATEQISPFKDAQHAACIVYHGQTDLSPSIGRLDIPSLSGRTIAGVVVYVSAMRRTHW